MCNINIVVFYSNPKSFDSEGEKQLTKEELSRVRFCHKNEA